MKVVLEGESSDEVHVESGVPQGTVLGPILFLCHINDLSSCVTSQVRLFADDCLVYREINHDHITLQSDLKQHEAWAQKWGMEFNAMKYHILSIRNKTQFFYSLNNEILKHVPNNPYLGVQLLSDLKWHTHTSSPKELVLLLVSIEGTLPYRADVSNNVSLSFIR